EFLKEFDFPFFKFSRKFNAEISEGFLNGGKIILAKPQTFMNNSGKAVKSLTLNLKPETLIVVHDDIDLPLGTIRIVQNRGEAGHKGVKSIIDVLGTRDFIRIRIGIKPINNQQLAIKKLEVERFVLKKFSKEEEKIVKEVLKKTAEAIEMILKEGQEEAMNKYNR
ncbi:MAG: aminoacyl-tRNA hydrolase, partial [Candidatus Nealsonbacteria bacterium CG23_combo_of_CG06-09_8_20_14_all_38_19]